MVTFIWLLINLTARSWAGSCSSILSPGAKIPVAEDLPFWEEPGVWIGSGLVLMVLRYFFKRRNANSGKNRPLS
jgi:hypothetical protein